MCVNRVFKPHRTKHVVPFCMSVPYNFFETNLLQENVLVVLMILFS